MTSADPTAAIVPEPTPEQTQSLSGYIQVWWQGVRGGELGSLPIILGLVDLRGLRDPRGQLPHRAELHEPAPADGGRGDHRNRHRLRPPDRRDRPFGRVRKRRRRGRDDAPPAPGQPRVALVGGDPLRAPLHDGHRLRPGARDHEGRRAVVRRHARRLTHLVRRRPHPHDPVLDGRHDQSSGREGRRHRERLPLRRLGLDPRSRGRGRLRAVPVPKRDGQAQRAGSQPSRPL